MKKPIRSVQAVLCASAWLVIAQCALATELQQYDIRVDGMVCPFCVATSERALKKITGVQAVSADLERGEISVCVDDQVKLTDAQLESLFLRNGFSYRSFTTAPVCSISDDREEHEVNHHHAKGHH